VIFLKDDILLSMFTSYKNAIKNYAEFSGRMSRRDFWFFFLGDVFITISLFVLIGAAGSISGAGKSIATVFSMVYVVYRFFLIIPILSANVRRLHDTDRSGWQLFIHFIPLAGPFIVLYFLLSKGDEGKNEYDASPSHANVADNTSKNSEKLEHAQSNIEPSKNKKKKTKPATIIAGVLGVLVIAVIPVIGYFTDDSTCRAVLKDINKERGSNIADGLYMHPGTCFVVDYDEENFFAYEENIWNQDKNLVQFIPSAVISNFELTDVGSIEPYEVSVVTASYFSIDWSLFNNLTQFDAMVEQFREDIIEQNDDVVILSEKPRTFMGNDGYEYVFTFTIDDEPMKGVDVIAFADEYGDSIHQSINENMYLMSYIAPIDQFDSYLSDANALIDNAHFGNTYSRDDFLETDTPLIATSGNYITEESQNVRISYDKDFFKTTRLEEDEIFSFNTSKGKRFGNIESIYLYTIDAPYRLDPESLQETTKELLEQQFPSATSVTSQSRDRMFMGKDGYEIIYDVQNSIENMYMQTVGANIDGKAYLFMYNAETDDFEKNIDRVNALIDSVEYVGE